MGLWENNDVLSQGIQTQHFAFFPGQALGHSKRTEQADSDEPKSFIEKDNCERGNDEDGLSPRLQRADLRF